MATFVQAITGLNSTGGNANLFTGNFVSSVTVGNMIIVACCLDAANATISSIVDTAGNNYAFLSSYSASTLTILVYYAYVRFGGTFAVQVTENFLDGEIFAQEWSGMATVDPVGLTINSTGSSASPTVGTTLTTINTNLVMFNILMLQSQTNTYGSGSGWSNLSTTASSFTSGAMQSQTTTTVGASITGNFTMTNTGITYIMHTVAVLTPGSVGQSDTGGKFGQAIDAPSGISTTGGVH